MKNNTILVIDDEIKAVEILKIKLQYLGLNIEYTLKGAETPEKAISVKPGLIILDILMPDVTGLQVLKILKENPLTNNIPVFILTSCENDSVKKDALKLGAAAYFQKPVDDKFITEVEKALSQ